MRTLKRYLYLIVVVASLLGFFKWVHYIVEGDQTPHWMSAPRA